MNFMMKRAIYQILILGAFALCAVVYYFENRWLNEGKETPTTIDYNEIEDQSFDRNLDSGAVELQEEKVAIKRDSNLKTNSIETYKNEDIYSIQNLVPGMDENMHSRRGLATAEGYDHIVKGCVRGHNIAIYEDKTVQECATFCNAHEDCYGFEYGVDYGGRGHNPGDCKPQSSPITEDCDGEEWNLDLYLKEGAQAFLLTPTQNVTGYTYILKGCVHGNNIVKYKFKTPQECATLCSARQDCEGFEYGMDYGGNKGNYEPGDCQLQSSPYHDGCNGAEYNLDLYLKQGAPTMMPTLGPAVTGYEYIPRGCVVGQNIKLYHQKTTQECAILCNIREDCDGFEYGVNYGGRGNYGPGDCQLQSSPITDGCDGAKWNLDFYRKEVGNGLFYCRSTGDPHFKSFLGRKFDNHDEGWQTLFEMGAVKIEAEHANIRPGTRVAINRAWRVSYDNQIIEQGEGGVIPSDDGIIILINPTVMVKIKTRFIRRLGYFIYDIFITTPNYDHAFGLCVDAQVIDQPPEYPEDPVVTIEEANEACAGIAGTNEFDDCVADIRLIDEPEAIEDIVGAATEAAAVEEKIIEIIQEVNNPTKSPTDPPTHLGEDSPTKAPVNSATDVYKVVSSDVGCGECYSIPSTFADCEAAGESAEVKKARNDYQFCDSKTSLVDRSSFLGPWWNITTSCFIRIGQFACMLSDSDMFVYRNCNNDSVNCGNGDEFPNDTMIICKRQDDCTLSPTEVTVAPTTSTPSLIISTPSPTFGTQSPTISTSSPTISTALPTSLTSSPSISTPSPTSSSIIDDSRSIGTQGDPIILGLKGQVFKFDGRDGGWYANLASKSFNWNMQFRKYPTCREGSDVFISGISLITPKELDREHQASESNILIATTPRPIEECRGYDKHCLGDGTLHISFDGGKNYISQPGDYHYGSRNRIVAHNTYAACSRRWHDYDITPNRRELNRMGGRRVTVEGKKSLEFLLEKKETMINPTECIEWIADRKNKNDLFEQKGFWSTMHIQTPSVSFHIEYRQSNPEKSKRVCDYQSLDAWMVSVSKDLEQQTWQGILGETKEKIYDTQGKQVVSNRNVLLKGLNDVDYEVDGPFGTTFNAKKGMNVLPW